MRTTFIILSLFCMIFFSCVNNQNNQPADYKFEITGTFGIKRIYSGSDVYFSNVILFTDDEGNNYNWKNVNSGWSHTWSKKGDECISITASNTSGEGDITIKLYRNDKLIESNTGYNGSHASIIIY